MSAQRLRDAAKVLRGRAEAATPGPWIAEYSKKSGHCVIDAESRNALDSVARATHFRDVGDATFIATMHPGVALALADWLDSVAGRATDIANTLILSGQAWAVARANVAGLDHATTVADLILGAE